MTRSVATTATTTTTTTRSSSTTKFNRIAARRARPETTAAVAAALVLAGCGTGGADTTDADHLPREIAPTVETEPEKFPPPIVTGAVSVFERAVGIERGYVGAVGETIQTVDFTDWELERRRTPTPEREPLIGMTGLSDAHSTSVYFLESLALAFETGLTEPLRSVAAQECESCRQLIEQTETNVVGGYYHDDLAFEMSSWFGLNAYADGSHEIWIDGIFHETDILGIQGGIVDIAEEFRFTAYVRMTLTAGDWQVAIVDLMDPAPDWSLE